MTCTTRNPAILRHAVTGAVALGLLAGCAGTGQLAKAVSHSGKAEARSTNQADRALAKLENAVAKNPQDAAARSALAHAYLQAGRFDSASTTFSDAMALGDSSPRTALSLALSHIGGGRNAEAVALLDQWRDSIPTGDLGLGLALAGETGRGVSILSDALRGGDNSPKLRQNLAYAYALDGRWSEARVMAAQDVPADQLDARISKWAMMGKAEDYQRRVAGLLGVPVATDSGQPARLALGTTPSYGPASAEVAELAARPRGGELAALDGTPGQVEAPVQPSAWNEPVAATPEPAQVAEHQSSGFESAFASPDTRYVSQPVVQTITGPVAETRRVVSERPVERAIARLSAASEADRQAASGVRDGTHLVQLGSFSSEANARRAWDVYRARHPELRDHDLTITPAVVRGKKFWRVAAAGFDRRTASSMCSSVKGRGGACIAYAGSSPLPGALPAAGTSGPMRARR